MAKRKEKKDNEIIKIPKEEQRDTIQVYGVMARSIHEGLQQFFPHFKSFQHGLEIRNIGKDKIPFMTFIQDMFNHYTKQLDQVEEENITPAEEHYYRGMGRILVDIQKALHDYA